MVVWEIESDGMDTTIITAKSHEEMVTQLVYRGFNRILKDDVPCCDEPLVVLDNQGREWTAMSAVFRSVHALPVNLVDVMSKLEPTDA
jgi:hypothetical protein|tara:strand:+ start:475 stop:738 length:264 start_codon:yes stop_codon:yes gene_type:complete